MAVVFLSISTILITIWLLLLHRAQPDDYSTVKSAQISDIKLLLQKTAEKERLLTEKFSGYPEVIVKLLLIYQSKKFGAKRAKLQRTGKFLQDGKILWSGILLIPGYVMQREYETFGKSNLRKTIYTHCFELYGKKNASTKAGQTFAKILSYPVLGLAAVMVPGAMLYSAGMISAGMGLTGIGSAIVLVLTYGIYDELNDMVSKRRTAISKQVPNAISKLALLVTSGMIIDRAWKETAFSQDTQLYTEMRKTSEELDNLVSPEIAYGGFINRCNTKETAKLASAIMQSRSKGNAEIGRLLKDMAREFWLERRHMAKRDAEKANSKLMLPTMLLFLAILVMLMVPIAMNFSGI